jgi:hypothetical protein
VKVFAMWAGGASYASPSIPDDVETFDSIDAAKAEFDNRCGGYASFRYANGTTYDTRTPAVSREPSDKGGPWMHVWHYDPREERDPYPDRLMEFGVKGGIKVERC